MTRWTPGPTFYPSPRLAAKAPAEKLAYIATFNPERKAPDALAVVDVDPSCASYAKIVVKLDLPNAGDELHHFGWNAYSTCLCPNAPHPSSSSNGRRATGRIRSGLRVVTHRQIPIAIPDTILMAQRG
jgi:methanethiol oxidase